MEIFKNQHKFTCESIKNLTLFRKEEVERIQQFLKIFLWYNIIENNFKIIGLCRNFSTENWAQIPAQSKASFFPQREFKFFKLKIMFQNIIIWFHIDKRTYDNFRQLFTFFFSNVDF